MIDPLLCKLCDTWVALVLLCAIVVKSTILRGQKQFRSKPILQDARRVRTRDGSWAAIILVKLKVVMYLTYKGVCSATSTLTTYTGIYLAIHKVGGIHRIRSVSQPLAVASAYFRSFPPRRCGHSRPSGLDQAVVRAYPAERARCRSGVELAAFLRLVRREIRSWQEHVFRAVYLTCRRDAPGVYKHVRTVLPGKVFETAIR